MNKFQPVAFELYTRAHLKWVRCILYWIAAFCGIMAAGCFLADFTRTGFCFIAGILAVAEIRYGYWVTVELIPYGCRRIPDGRNLIFDSDGITIDSRGKFHIAKEDIKFISASAAQIIFVCDNGKRYCIRNCKKSSKALVGFQQFRDDIWMPYQESKLDPNAPRLDFRLPPGGGLNLVIAGKKRGTPAEKPLSGRRLVCYTLVMFIAIVFLEHFAGFDNPFPAYIIAASFPLSFVAASAWDNWTKKLLELTTKYRGVILSREGMQFYGESELTIPWDECNILKINDAELLFRWRNRKYDLPYSAFILPVAARRFFQKFAARYVENPPEEA